MAKFKPFKFDPIAELGIEIPRNARREALDEVASYLHEELLNFIGDGKSPVAGGVWKKKLTTGYEKLKAEESGAGFANLELTGELLDSIRVEAKGAKIVIDLDRDQYDKAEGHITGQYGAGKMKKDYRRQFIPQGNEELKRGIMANVKRILKEFEDGES